MECIGKRKIIILKLEYMEILSSCRNNYYDYCKSRYKYISSRWCLKKYLLFANTKMLKMIKILVALQN